ncbi:MAG: hypothetical protein ABI972_12915 [Acidobacteriota bacterium]
MDWVANNWGNVASVVGLLVSIATLWVAQGARKAAQAARAEVHRKVLTDDLAMLASHARDMASFVSGEQWAWADMRALELITELNRVSERWKLRLPPEIAESLLLAIEELMSCRQILVRAPAKAVSAREKRDLTGSADRIASHLAASHGKMTQPD